MTARRNRAVDEEPFERLGELGTGGFATTWKARVLDEELIEEWGTDVVALKIPHKDKERVLHKELEMNALLHMRLKDLQAANLVRYLGFCVYQGRIVMAMQYVSGGSLRDHIGPIGRQKPLPLEEAVDIAEAVLCGLEAIHREHIFHRDIKPENILLDGRIPKIADLGISRMLDSKELASTTTGTLFYMSPEILSQEGASFTADLWSLAVTLYEMVTGRLPLGGLGIPLGAMVNIILNAEITPPREHRPEIPEELESIILRALRREPADRFGSADEMMQHLRAWREGESDSVDAELEAARALLSSMEPAPDAEDKLKDLLDRFPDEPKAFQYLGEYYNRCQRYGDAIVIFEQGLSRVPDSALLHWDLALAYQKKGQKEEARRNIEQAMSLGLDASLQRHAAMMLKILQAG